MVKNAVMGNRNQRDDLTCFKSDSSNLPEAVGLVFKDAPRQYYSRPRHVLIQKTDNLFDKNDGELLTPRVSMPIFVSLRTQMISK